MLQQSLAEPLPGADEPLVTVTRADLRADPGMVRLAVHACAVCRTDLQLCEGDLRARKLPIVPGHQIVGIVDEVGEGADQQLLGKRVGVAWIASTCGSCRFCLSGRENLCRDATFTGWDVDGGFGEQAVADARFVYEIPDEYSSLEAAPLLCGGAIGYRSLRVAGVGPNAPGRLGLLGFGASATIAIQVARHWGWEVHVLTRSEREQRRALALGAVWAGSYGDRPPSLLDAAVSFAPVGSVVVRALELIDRGGIVAINAIHLDEIPGFDYDSLWWERSLRSVANVTRDDVVELLALAAQVPLRPEVEPCRLVDVNRALQRLRDGEVSGAAVLDIGLVG